MRNIWLVLKEEIYVTVWRKGFWLFLILLPLGSFGLYWFLLGINQASVGDQPEGAVGEISDFLLAPPEEKMTGVVDESGLVRRFPSDLVAEMRKYSSEEAAAFDLRAGVIQSYFIIPADYLDSGQVTLVREDISPLGGLPDTSLLISTLNFNLLNGDEALSGRLQNLMELEVEYLSEETARKPDEPATFLLPYVVMMLYFFVIMGSSSMMMSSVTVEKSTRMLEILLTSATPLQIMAGKIIGLGLVGLFQTLVWSGAAYAFAFSRGTTLLPADFHLPPSILGWGVVYFLLGYVIYAALLGGLGALTSSSRDASLVSSMIMLPTMLPLFFIGVLIQQPNGPVALILSLFPMTAPVTMMARLALTRVPFWQHSLVIALLMITAWLVVRSAAGMFHAQHMLSGQPFKLKLFFKALIGKA